MPWELIIGALLVPYVIFLETRIMSINTALERKLDREAVKELVDMKQEAVIEKIDNLKEDIKELKEQLKEISGKL